MTAIIEGKRIAPEWCFAIPGETIIDIVDPATERTCIYGRTLDEVRAEEGYASAIKMRVDDFCKDKAARQDAESKEWEETTEEKYYDMLNVLPPAAMCNGAFLVGEPWDHHAVTGRPRFSCYRMTNFQHEGEKFFKLKGCITHAQFCEMFGKTANTYVE